MSDPLEKRAHIQVGIVEDHRVLAEALRISAEREPDLRVLWIAATCAEALDVLGRNCPDVILLDLGLPDGDGLSLIPSIKKTCPKCHVLVLTSLSDERTLMRAVETGISGFVGKDRPLAELFSAVRLALRGEIVMPRSLLLGVLTRLSHSSRAAKLPADGITPRELEILQLLARGRSGPVIAEKLKITPLTVRTHIRNLMEKLGVHSRLEAVALALRTGLIDPPA